jgi:hypothetical protein
VIVEGVQALRPGAPVDIVTGAAAPPADQGARAGSPGIRG